MTTKVRKYLDGQEKEMSDETSIYFVDENGEEAVGKTEQCHKNECDINNVIKKYDKHKIFTHVNNTIGHYGDYTEVDEFAVALNKVAKAQELFDALPSEIRKEFNNDPGDYIEFVTNPENMDKMVEMGLAKAQPQIIEEIIKVEVTNPTKEPKAKSE